MCGEKNDENVMKINAKRKEEAVVAVCDVCTVSANKLYVRDRLNEVKVINSKRNVQDPSFSKLHNRKKYLPQISRKLSKNYLIFKVKKNVLDVICYLISTEPSLL